MRNLLLPAFITLMLVTGCATSKTKELAQTYPTSGEQAFKRAEKELRNGNLDRATRRFKAVLASYQKLDERKTVARIYNRLGTIALLQNDLQKAAAYINSAELTAEMEGFGEILFRSRLNRVSLLITKDELDDAKNILESLVAPKNAKAELDNITGLLLMRDGQDDEAEKKFFAVIKNSDTESLKSTAYSNLGSLYLKTGETDKALEYLKKALAINKRVEMPLLIGQNLHLIGKAYEQKTDYKNAIYHYNRALHINIHLSIRARENTDREAIKRVKSLIELQ